jgi:hypothetical protein
MAYKARLSSGYRLYIKAFREALRTVLRFACPVFRIVARSNAEGSALREA